MKNDDDQIDWKSIAHGLANALVTFVSYVDCSENISDYDQGDCNGARKALDAYEKVAFSFHNSLQ